MLAWILVGLLAIYGAVETVRRLRLAAQLAAAQAQLTEAAMRDELTALLNPAAFQAQVDHKAQRVKQSGGSFCVLYVGLDNFERLNDGFGESVGDALLLEAARRIATAKGIEMEACRMFGSEYALLVSGGDALGTGMAKSILAKLAEPFDTQGLNTRLSGSVGIAVYPEHGAPEKIVGHAAVAMRSVKAGGGNDFCVYDPQMGMEIREQVKLVNDLRAAIAQHQLQLYFQPKIDAATLQVTAAEALLRWHHPQRGFVSPVVFIPLAERHGLIGDIGRWVIDEACRHAGKWREKGLRMRVAVNISGYQMREDDLVDRIEAALARNRLQPGRFTCEITESVAMEDTKVTRQTFERMRRAGLHVSIDDFGTGYSSLAALRKLPAAEMKVDRAFVCDLEDSEDARIIVSSILHMAKALNLRVVAEGVETAGQCDLLVKMGCNELQGYLFSKPVPGDEIQRLAIEGLGFGGAGFSDSLFQPTNLAKL
ncbi:MAG TPA: phosphodiesterase [Burkholderiaceae bacterium]|nr:phosphodiesterase [Burkholderiaceae bacterium]